MMGAIELTGRCSIGNRASIVAFLLIWVAVAGCKKPIATSAYAEDAPKGTAKSGADEAPWTSMFDGKSLGKWRVTDFGGHGEVLVEEGKIVLGMGAILTGIDWTGELPRMDYEISLQAMREDGSDFFCGLTFPVGKDPCSLIVGGWGGGVVGLSSLDGLDASENETTSYMAFDSKKWYTIRLRVTQGKIEAWVDKEKVADVDTTDKKIGIRPEVELSKPLGISAYCTTAALRDIKIRSLKPEKQSDEKKKK